jgi:regulatory protein
MADDADRPDASPFRDAEAWLAERGIERDPIRLSPPDPGPDGAAGPGGAATGPEVSPREAARLASQAAADARAGADDAAAAPDASRPRLEDDVAEAVAYIRSSTATAPQSEGRLRAKLADRGWNAVVVDRALERARQQRLVDDAAMAAALVEERRRKGHAPARIRRDLAARGFDEATLDPALADAEAEDPEAAAFALARDRAAGLTALSAEAAFRRVAAYVARRGYPEGLARKVARSAVFTTRDPERTAGH